VGGRLIAQGALPFTPRTPEMSVRKMKIRPPDASSGVERRRRFGRPLLEVREKWRTHSYRRLILRANLRCACQLKWPTRRELDGAPSRV